MTQREQIAVHEVGHGVAAVELEGEVHSVSLRESHGETVGETRASLPKDAMKQGMYLAAGAAAEQMLCGSTDAMKNEGDRQAIAKLARTISGIGEEIPEMALPYEDKRKIEKAKRAVTAQADAIVLKHRQAIEDLAVELSASGELSGDRIRARLRERP